MQHLSLGHRFRALAGEFFRVASSDDWLDGQWRWDQPHGTCLDLPRIQFRMVEGLKWLKWRLDPQRAVMPACGIMAGIFVWRKAVRNRHF